MELVEAFLGQRKEASLATRVDTLTAALDTAQQELALARRQLADVKYDPFALLSVNLTLQRRVGELQLEAWTLRQEREQARVAASDAAGLGNASSSPAAPTSGTLARRSTWATLSPSMQPRQRDASPAPFLAPGEADITSGQPHLLASPGSSEPSASPSPSLAPVQASPARRDMAPGTQQWERERAELSAQIIAYMEFYEEHQHKLLHNTQVLEAFMRERVLDWWSISTQAQHRVDAFAEGMNQMHSLLSLLIVACSLQRQGPGHRILGEPGPGEEEVTPEHSDDADLEGELAMLPAFLERELAGLLDRVDRLHQSLHALNHHTREQMRAIAEGLRPVHRLLGTGDAAEVGTSAPTSPLARWTAPLTPGGPRPVPEDLSLVRLSVTAVEAEVRRFLPSDAGAGEGQDSIPLASLALELRKRESRIVELTVSDQRLREENERLADLVTSLHSKCQLLDKELASMASPLRVDAQSTLPSTTAPSATSTGPVHGNIIREQQLASLLELLQLQLSPHQGSDAAPPSPSKDAEHGPGVAVRARIDGGSPVHNHASGSPITPSNELHVMGNLFVEKIRLEAQVVELGKRLAQEQTAAASDKAALASMQQDLTACQSQLAAAQAAQAHTARELGGVTVLAEQREVEVSRLRQELWLLQASAEEAREREHALADERWERQLAGVRQLQALELDEQRARFQAELERVAAERDGVLSPVPPVLVAIATSPRAPSPDLMPVNGPVVKSPGSVAISPPGADVALGQLDLDLAASTSRILDLEGQLNVSTGVERRLQEELRAVIGSRTRAEAEHAQALESLQATCGELEQELELSEARAAEAKAEAQGRLYYLSSSLEQEQRRTAALATQLEEAVQAHGRAHSAASADLARAEQRAQSTQRELAEMASSRAEMATELERHQAMLHAEQAEHARTKEVLANVEGEVGLLRQQLEEAAASKQRQVDSLTSALEDHQAEFAARQQRYAEHAQRLMDEFSGATARSEALASEVQTLRAARKRERSAERATPPDTPALSARARDEAQAERQRVQTLRKQLLERNTELELLRVEHASLIARQGKGDQELTALHEAHERARTQHAAQISKLADELAAATRALEAEQEHHSLTGRRLQAAQEEGAKGLRDLAALQQEAEATARARGNQQLAWRSECDALLARERELLQFNAQLNTRVEEEAQQSQRQQAECQRWRALSGTVRAGLTGLRERYVSFQGACAAAAEGLYQRLASAEASLQATQGQAKLVRKRLEALRSVNAVLLAERDALLLGRQHKQHLQPPPARDQSPSIPASELPPQSERRESLSLQRLSPILQHETQLIQQVDQLEEQLRAATRDAQHRARQVRKLTAMIGWACAQLDGGQDPASMPSTPLSPVSPSLPGLGMGGEGHGSLITLLRERVLEVVARRQPALAAMDGPSALSLSQAATQTYTRVSQGMHMGTQTAPNAPVPYPPASPTKVHVAALQGMTKFFTHQMAGLEAAVSARAAGLTSRTARAAGALAREATRHQAQLRVVPRLDLELQEQSKALEAERAAHARALDRAVGLERELQHSILEQQEQERRALQAVTAHKVELEQQRLHLLATHRQELEAEHLEQATHEQAAKASITQLRGQLASATAELRERQAELMACQRQLTELEGAREELRTVRQERNLLSVRVHELATANAALSENVRLAERKQARTEARSAEVYHELIAARAAAAADEERARQRVGALEAQASQLRANLEEERRLASALQLGVQMALVRSTSSDPTGEGEYPMPGADLASVPLLASGVELVLEQLDAALAAINHAAVPSVHAAPNPDVEMRELAHALRHEQSAFATLREQHSQLTAEYEAFRQTSAAEQESGNRERGLRLRALEEAHARERLRLERGLSDRAAEAQRLITEQERLQALMDGQRAEGQARQARIAALEAAVRAAEASGARAREDANLVRVELDLVSRRLEAAHAAAKVERASMATERALLRDQATGAEDRARTGESELQARISELEVLEERAGLLQVELQEERERMRALTLRYQGACAERDGLAADVPRLASELDVARKLAQSWQRRHEEQGELASTLRVELAEERKRQAAMEHELELAEGREADLHQALDFAQQQLAACTGKCAQQEQELARVRGGQAELHLDLEVLQREAKAHLAEYASEMQTLRAQLTMRLNAAARERRGLENDLITMAAGLEERELQLAQATQQQAVLQHAMGAAHEEHRLEQARLHQELLRQRQAVVEAEVRMDTVSDDARARTTPGSASASAEAEVLAARQRLVELEAKHRNLVDAVIACAGAMGMALGQPSDPLPVPDPLARMQDEVRRGWAELAELLRMLGETGQPHADEAALLAQDIVRSSASRCAQLWREAASSGRRVHVATSTPPAAKTRQVGTQWAEDLSEIAVTTGISSPGDILGLERPSKESHLRKLAACAMRHVIRLRKAHRPLVAALREKAAALEDALRDVAFCKGRTLQVEAAWEARMREAQAHGKQAMWAAEEARNSLRQERDGLQERARQREAALQEELHELQARMQVLLLDREVAVRQQHTQPASPPKRVVSTLSTATQCGTPGTREAGCQVDQSCARLPPQQLDATTQLVPAIRDASCQAANPLARPNLHTRLLQDATTQLVPAIRDASCQAATPLDRPDLHTRLLQDATTQLVPAIRDASCQAATPLDRPDLHARLLQDAATQHSLITPGASAEATQTSTSPCADGQAQTDVKVLVEAHVGNHVTFRDATGQTEAEAVQEPLVSWAAVATQTLPVVERPPLLSAQSQTVLLPPPSPSPVRVNRGCQPSPPWQTDGALATIAIMTEACVNTGSSPMPPKPQEHAGSITGEWSVEHPDQPRDRASPSPPWSAHRDGQASPSHDSQALATTVSCAGPVPPEVLAKSPVLEVPVPWLHTLEDEMEVSPEVASASAAVSPYPHQRPPSPTIQDMKGNMSLPTPEVLVSLAEDVEDAPAEPELPEGEEALLMADYHVLLQSIQSAMARDKTATCSSGPVRSVPVPGAVIEQTEPEAALIRRGSPPARSAKPRDMATGAVPRTPMSMGLESSDLVHGANSELLPEGTADPQSDPTLDVLLQESERAMRATRVLLREGSAEQEGFSDPMRTGALDPDDSYVNLLQLSVAALGESQRMLQAAGPPRRGVPREVPRGRGLRPLGLEPPIDELQALHLAAEHSLQCSYALLEGASTTMSKGRWHAPTHLGAALPFPSRV